MAKGLTAMDGLTVINGSTFTAAVGNGDCRINVYGDSDGRLDSNQWFDVYRGGVQQ